MLIMHSKICLAFFILIEVFALSSGESYVTPINDQLFKSAKIPSDENSKISEKVHLNTNKYCLTTWWKKWFANQTSLQYLTFKGNNQMDVHPVTDEAMSLAISLKTGIYNESYVGIKKEVALNSTIKMIASLSKAHMSNTKGGWGHGWQTAQWAYDGGLGAWLIWDHIKDKQDRQYIENMIISESDRLLTFKVPYYQAVNGHINFPGDTKAEENGWDSRVLQLSTVMMKTHPNQKKWKTKMTELMISSYARPSDLNSSVVLNGKKLKDWLNGSNIFENGTLVNHNKIHPDYMQCIAYMLGCAITYAIANESTPEVAFHNDAVVYRAFNELNFPSPPFHKPGGTIYVRSKDGNFTGDVYYPQTDDWGTGLRMQFAALDSMMTLFSKHGKEFHSEEWQKQHVSEVLRMQNRYKDGQTYANKSEDSSPMSEEWVAQWSSFNYLARFVGHNYKITTTNQDFS